MVLIKVENVDKKNLSDEFFHFEMSLAVTSLLISRGSKIRSLTQKRHSRASNEIITG